MDSGPTVSRRRFMEGSARAALGAAGGLSLWGTSRSWAGANDRVRVAVVGIHGHGFGSHIRNYPFLPNVEEGHYSCALIHLANTSYRLGRSLNFDPQRQRYRDDDEANRMLSRDYRAPFIVPRQV
jgi:hypothetical protein